MASQSGEANTGQARQRLDKWLFFARIAKSRALAASFARAGQVRINGRKVEDAAAPVRIGDVLTIALGQNVRVLRVTGLGDRRGPASEAEGLYEAVTTCG
jgi:ribosome-associated heat shock protein Hsp15